MANRVRFSIAKHAAWAPGIAGLEAWAAWAADPFLIEAGSDPAVAAMPAMLRRRAGALGKMALEVAYGCLDGQLDVPTVFCSRHGEVGRAVTLLEELSAEGGVSPTGFGLAVHNASAGLFSIARQDRANHISLAGGASTVEHALIECCGLLADGVPQVLLVAYDAPLPPVFSHFEDCQEQPHAWAWLLEPAGAEHLSLSWDDAPVGGIESKMPGSLEVLRFQLGSDAQMQRHDGLRRWTWSRHA